LLGHDCLPRPVRDPPATGATGTRSTTKPRPRGGPPFAFTENPAGAGCRRLGADGRRAHRSAVGRRRHRTERIVESDIAIAPRAGPTWTPKRRDRCGHREPTSTGRSAPPCARPGTPMRLLRHGRGLSIFDIESNIVYLGDVKDF